MHTIWVELANKYNAIVMGTPYVLRGCKPKIEPAGLGVGTAWVRLASDCSAMVMRAPSVPRVASKGSGLQGITMGRVPACQGKVDGHVLAKPATWHLVLAWVMQRPAGKEPQSECMQ